MWKTDKRSKNRFYFRKVIQISPIFRYQNQIRTQNRRDAYDLKLDKTKIFTFFSKKSSQIFLWETDKVPNNYSYFREVILIPSSVSELNSHTNRRCTYDLKLSK